MIILKKTDPNQNQFLILIRKKEKANFKNQNLKKRIFTGKEKSETYGSSRLASHSICLSIHAY
ncbi:hypothetical protein NUITMVRE18_13590 [Enterococcus faecium]|nr:predicted protein [Enterococcus faecium 1,230,933]BBU65739.1 hypothetical protein EfmKUHS13_13570 [Enterococcus faecium]BCZ33495.1 hypothetical protein GVanDAA620_13850 [Enterococcus faecium]BCZ36695.1 hypothetical protein GVanDAA622_13860 [Enterococcus faecium]BDP46433.1 hypothetical protein EfmJHP9_13030 [Enterococcus faecium]